MGPFRLSCQSGISSLHSLHQPSSYFPALRQWTHLICLPFSSSRTMLFPRSASSGVLAVFKSWSAPIMFDISTKSRYGCFRNNSTPSLSSFVSVPSVQWSIRAMYSDCLLLGCIFMEFIAEHKAICTDAILVYCKNVIPVLIGVPTYRTHTDAH